jgi:DNA polymerase-3 subunit epsilon
LNPERDMPAEAEAVHGLSAVFLSDKPLFAEIAEEFEAFIAESIIVAHNASFDLGFINAELKQAGREIIPKERTIDTVALARRKFPGAQASLDALCKRFNVDTSARDKHGALLDAKLLAQVYLELIGGREPGLVLAAEEKQVEEVRVTAPREMRAARPHAPTSEEKAAHAAFVSSLKDPIWNRA